MSSDWKTFLHTRLDGHGPKAPLDGIRRGGYKLVHTDTPSDYYAAFENDLTRSNQIIAVNGTAYGIELLERAGDGPAYLDEILAPRK